MLNFINFFVKVVFKNEADFIKSLKNGDSKAYTYLVDSFHHKLCIYAYSLTNNHDYSEDIVQNVIINVWKKRNQLKADFSIKKYLFRSVYNEFIDQYRKKKSILELEKKYIETLNTIVEENEKSLDRLITIVNHEIENLPPKCKQTFLLSKQEGLTNIEIAEYLNVSIKSVEAHITKAFSILRKSMRVNKI